MDSKLIVLVLIGVFHQHCVQGAAPAWSAVIETADCAEDAAVDYTLTFTGTPAFDGSGGTPTSVSIVDPTPATAVAAFSVALNAASDGIVVKIKATGQLDRETDATLAVSIRAANADGDTSGSDLVLTVTVTDANDNAPVFSPMYACVSMQADTAANTALITMGATDADTVTNGLGGGNYAWSSSTPTAASTKLAIDAGTGAVTVAAGQTLLAADGPWTLYAVATDDGTTAMTATASLSVCIGSGCCSGTVIIQGATAVIVLGLLSLFL